MTVRSITSLSTEDVKWIHQTAQADTEKGRQIHPDLSEAEFETWRIICTIAALTSHSLK